MSSIEELERQYTPSLFSKRFSTREELIENFIKVTTNESARNRMNFDCHLNVAYGNTKRQKLDIYGDDLSKDVPLFVFIHGGYWQQIDKESSAFFVKPLYERNIRSITIDYDLCPQVSLEEIVEQVKKCFSWIAKYVNENQIKKIAIVGHSAGGHLLCYAIDKQIMKEISPTVEVHAFFISGIYYLEELRYLKAANENDILKINDDNCRRLSPQYRDFSYLLNYNFAAHVFAAEHESDKYKEYATEFSQGPIKDFLGNFKILPDVDHFNIVEKLSDTEFELTQLIIKSLKN